MAKHPAVCASLSLKSVDGPVSSGAQVRNGTNTSFQSHDRG